MFRRRLLIACLLGAILLIPFPTTVVPEWRIRVLDQSGNPMVGEVVREIWQNYSLESNGHEEERLTDQNGSVTFPERRIWSPLLLRIVFTTLAAASTIVHGSMGVDAWIMVVGYSTGGGTRTYEPGKALPSEIILRR